MNNGIFGFNISFSDDGGLQYLLLTKEDIGLKQIIEYQVEMINHNKIPGVLKLDLREKNLQIEFIYNLTGWTNLNSYLEKEQVNKHIMLTIIDRTLNTIIESKNYFLNDTSFVLNENIIYINPTTLEIGLVYIPVELQQDLTHSFKLFIVELLINHPSIKNDDYYIQDLLLQLKNEDFNVPNFSRYLKKLKGDILHKTTEFNEFSHDVNLYSTDNNTYNEENAFPSAQQIQYTKIVSENEMPINKDIANNQDPVKPVRDKKNTRTLVLGVIAVISVLAAIISNIINSLSSPFNIGKYVFIIVGGIIVGIIILITFIVMIKKKPNNHNFTTDC